MNRWFLKENLLYPYNIKHVQVLLSNDYDYLLCLQYCQWFLIKLQTTISILLTLFCLLIKPTSQDMAL